MGKLIARLVVGLAVLYGVAATIFAFANYSGAKPDVPTILGDFHGWLGSLTTQRKGEPPPTPSPAPKAPGETPAPPPETPAPTTDTPPSAETPAGDAPATGRQPPPGLAGEALELWRIENLVLPQASKKARLLRNMTREDAAAFETARTDVMASLGDARTLLNSILERDSSHRQANRLWNALQELYQAVKKL